MNNRIKSKPYKPQFVARRAEVYMFVMPARQSEIIYYIHGISAGANSNMTAFAKT